MSINYPPILAIPAVQNPVVLKRFYDTVPEKLTELDILLSEFPRTVDESYIQKHHYELVVGIKDVEAVFSAGLPDVRAPHTYFYPVKMPAALMWKRISNPNAEAIIGAYQSVTAEDEIEHTDVNWAEYQAGIFLSKSANYWMQDAALRPMPKMLFSEFWFEEEVCIFFGDSNTGKSLLGVQIGEAIASGKPVKGFKLEARPQKVLYFDFELSDKQFEIRYSYNDGAAPDFVHYAFSENFRRVEMNAELWDKEQGSFEAIMLQSFESIIKAEGASVVILDNITWLTRRPEKSEEAAALMKELKRIKARLGCSILVLAHTPKRDATKPITRNDLQGSSMLMNFADSSFAIGKSHQDDGLRYIKQIKVRNVTTMYGRDNVLVGEIRKTDGFTGFEFLTLGEEDDHLKIIGKENTAERDATILDLNRRGKSTRQIASEVGISQSAVTKILKKSKKGKELPEDVPF